MSYMSGFMLGTALAGSIRQMFTGKSLSGFAGMPSAQPFHHVAPREPFALVASSAGRRRYRAAYIASGLADQLEQTLNRLDYINQAQVNAATGSILLLFDESHAAQVDALAEWLRTHLFTPRRPAAGAAGGSAATAVQSAQRPMAEAGTLTRSIHDTARAFSNWIRRISGGVLDMSSFAAILLLLRGIRKTLFTHAYPSGMQMLWWALTIMRGWRVA